jgi:hypothetical protein
VSFMTKTLPNCTKVKNSVTLMRPGERKEGKKESLSVYISGCGCSRSIARSIDVCFLLDCLEFDVESWVGGDMRAF